MNDHIHHYIIGIVPVNGRLPGSCKVCGVSKAWPAHMDAAYNPRSGYETPSVYREKPEFAMSDEGMQ